MNVVTAAPVVASRRAGRWARRAAKVVLSVVAGLFVLIFTVGPYWLVKQFMSVRHSYNDPDNGRTPAAFGLAFEEASFTSADGVALRGWWVPAEAGSGSAVLVHGWNRSRAEMVGKVPFLHAQGLNVLLFDARHHGESGGTLSSFGYLERLDVRAAVAEARRRAPGPILAWGVSLGAAAAVMAAAEDETISAVVSDATYLSLPDTVRHHAALAREWRAWIRVLPTGLLAESALFWIKHRGGFDPAAVDVEAAARRLGSRPALFVCNAGDKRMPSAIAFALKEAAGPHARVLVVPGHSHGGSYREATAAYEHAVAGVWQEVRAAAPGAAGGTH
jgi:hypothetical protein